MFRKATTKIRRCAGCGAKPVRGRAVYCQVCGKNFAADYEPLDTMRSAHHLQNKSFLVENLERGRVTDLFEVNRNPVSEMAWASCVYSMVPYLGIVFIPVTLCMALVGLFVSFRRPLAGGFKLSIASLGLSILILAMQLFLWWLLYVIPELGRSI